MTFFFPSNLPFKSVTSIPDGKRAGFCLGVRGSFSSVFLIEGVKAGGMAGMSSVALPEVPGSTDDVPAPFKFASSPLSLEKGSSVSLVFELTLFAFFGVAEPPTFSGEME